MKHSVFKVKLKNGSKGLLVHVPSASVMNIELNFRAGEYLVKGNKWETPHIMEHMLLGANKMYPKSRLFQAEIEKNGAYSNASTGVYDITYEAECADFEWDRILDLMLLAISKPLFLEEEFNAEFGNVKEELTARSNNHFRHLSLALRERYGFLAKTDQERVELMENIKLQDIKKHYKLTHTTSNLRFVIAGNITPKRKEALLKMMEELDLPKGEGRIPLPDERPARVSKPLVINDKSVKNLYFYIDSFMNRRMKDEETMALGLVNTMLTETLYSKILGTARERGLVYGMSSGFGQTWHSSNWWFGAQVSRKNAPELFEIIVSELQKVFSGDLDSADIEAAKAYSIGRFQRGAQTVGGISSGYSGRYFFDEQVEDYYQVPHRIREVTKQQMIDVSRDLFKDDIWGMGALSNCDETFVDELHDLISPLWDRSQLLAKHK